MAAGGKSAIISLAQSLLVTRHQPVAIVMDADSVEIERIHEQERIYYDLLRTRAMDVPFKVILAIPDIVFLFFEDPEVLKGTGIQMTERDALEAKYRPQQTLERLLPKTGARSRSQFVQSLSDSAIERLAQLPLAKTAEFVEKPSILFDLDQRQRMGGLPGKRNRLTAVPSDAGSQNPCSTRALISAYAASISAAKAASSAGIPGVSFT